MRLRKVCLGFDRGSPFGVLAIQADQHCWAIATKLGAWLIVLFLIQSRYDAQVLDRSDPMMAQLQ